MSGVLFDSNVVIDILGGHPQALEEFRRYEEVAISVVSWIEVMAGSAPDIEPALRRTLGGYAPIELDADIAERAARIRRERRIKLPDAIIQATAESRRLLLVTRNERDFPASLPGVRIPYRL